MATGQDLTRANASATAGRVVARGAAAVRTVTTLASGPVGAVRALARRPAAWLVGVIASPLVVAFFAAAFASAGSEPASTPSDAALADIPATFLELYQQAAATYSLDWAVLAGIGELECDHGRSQLAGCNPRGSVNSAGARGPMQFLGSTWRASAAVDAPEVAGPPVPAGAEAQGYATDGDHDGVADPWSPADAITAAARYLHASGAPANYPAAIWAYNHSDVYRDEVLRWAGTYRGEGAAVGPAVAAGGPVEIKSVRGIRVNAAIADQLEELLAAAESDGLQLTGWGYRSNAEQIQLRREHCGTSDYAINDMPAGQCSPPTARPGTSMHEKGLAIDFANCSTRTTRCWQWLNSHAATWGLHNLASEPWHWSTDGH